MSSHYEFRKVSFRRKAAVAVAIVCFGVFVAFILPEWTRRPFQALSPTAVLVTTCLSAISSAIAIVEIARATLPSTLGWSDERHFRFVILAFGVLLAIQFTGLLFVLSSNR